MGTDETTLWYWDVCLTDVEIHALAAGVDPWSILPDHLIPLDDD